MLLYAVLHQHAWLLGLCMFTFCSWSSRFIQRSCWLTDCWCQGVPALSGSASMMVGDSVTVSALLLLTICLPLDQNICTHATPNLLTQCCKGYAVPSEACVHSYVTVCVISLLLSMQACSLVVPDSLTAVLLLWLQSCCIAVSYSGSRSWSQHVTRPVC